MKSYAAALLAIFATSCSQGMIRPTNDSADYGQVPSDYQTQIKKYWERTLKDPASLQIRSIGTPDRGVIYSTITKDHFYDAYTDVEFIPVYGHRVCAIYNAKNSYGGYVGWKPATFFFDNSGKIHAPLFMSIDDMKGMHRKGLYGESTRITSAGCPGE